MPLTSYYWFDLYKMFGLFVFKIHVLANILLFNYVTIYYSFGNHGVEVIKLFTFICGERFEDIFSCVNL